MSPSLARPRKGHRGQRLRVNVKEPIGRLRERKAALEALIDTEHFDRTLSLTLAVIARLESGQ
jgi:hypothetical protein